MGYGFVALAQTDSHRILPLILNNAQHIMQIPPETTHHRPQTTVTTPGLGTGTGHDWDWDGLGLVAVAVVCCCCRGVAVAGSVVLLVI
jgi:hypothetical protein